MADNTKNSTELYYPITKMNFIVSVDSVDGVAAFNEVSGIDASVEVIEFRQGNSTSLAPVKVMGLVKHGNLTLKMGYTRSQAFKNWVKDCVDERRKTGLRRNLTIEMVDIREGAPSSLSTTTSGDLIWVFSDAWVCKYTGPDLNSMTSEIAIETIEIAYEELKIPN